MTDNGGNEPRTGVDTHRREKYVQPDALAPLTMNNSSSERQSGIEIMLGPVLGCNPDIVLAGGFLILDPVAHTCRRIFATRSSFVADHAFLEWSVDVLFLIELSQTAWGPIAAKRGKHFIEAISYPNYRVTDVACREMETKHLALLRELDSLETCYDYLMSSDRPISLWPERHISPWSSRWGISMPHICWLDGIVSDGSPSYLKKTTGKTTA